MNGFAPEVVISRPGAVDTEPKRFGAIRRYGPWVLLGVRLTAAVWPLWLPVAVLLVVLGPAGFVVGLVLVVVAWWRLHRYRQLIESSRVHVLTAVLRHQWPSICSLCGFSMPGDRRARCPRLASVEFGPGWLKQPWWVIEVIPLAQHDEPTWHRYGSRLQRQLRFAAHDQRPTDGGGSVVITLARHPLPTMVELDRSHLGARDDRDRDQVLVGVDAMGEPIDWTPDDEGRSMVFVGGTQGGGKSNIVNACLAQGLAYSIDASRHDMIGGWDIRIVDPAGVDFAWLDELATVATTPVDMFAAVFDARAEIDRRSEVMKRHRVNNWRKLPPDVARAENMHRRVVLVVDELVALMAMKGRVVQEPEGGKGRSKDLFADMAAALADVAALGRKVGVTVIAATQHPIAEHLGPFGSTFKANLGARIGTGALEPEGAGSLFGKSEGAEVSAFLGSRIPGRMVTRSLSAAGQQTRRHGQAFFVPDELLTALATEARQLLNRPAALDGGEVIPFQPPAPAGSQPDDNRHDDGATDTREVS
ncbi:MAG: FtsK/SpoIIIE domain-containing protein [Actinomycetota bacterium]